jgi:hypothetical protein
MRAIRACRCDSDARLWLDLVVMALLFNAVPFTLFAYGERHVSSIARKRLSGRPDGAVAQPAGPASRTRTTRPSGGTTGSLFRVFCSGLMPRGRGGRENQGGVVRIETAAQDYGMRRSAVREGEGGCVHDDVPAMRRP